MDFSVLGPVTATVAGSTSVVPAKPRELLALLLTTPNRPRPADVLIDRLWRERPPRSAASALRTYVATLRTALRTGPNGVSRLGHTTHGYVVTVEDGELDAAVFEAAIADARRLDVIRRAAPVERALQLWGSLHEPLASEPYAGIFDIPDVDHARDHLLDLRREAHVMLTEALVATGRNDVAADLSARWLVEHPTSEDLARHHVAARYRAGDQVGALAAWRQFRNRLVDDFGIEPKAAFRALELDLLRQAEHLDEVAAAETPDQPVWALDEREPLLEDVWRSLGSGSAARVLSISGPPGLGKSTVLRELQRVTGAPLITGHDRARSLLAVEELVVQLDASLLPRMGNDSVVHARLAAEVRDLFGSRPRPILVDDIERCDEDSLEVLRRLLRSGVGPIVTTSRAPNLRDHPLLQDTATLNSSDVFALRPLSRHGITALLERSLDAVDEDQIDWFEAATAGNPFLVVALSRAVAGGADRSAMPPVALEYLRRLIDALGEGAAAWLAAAAVDGAGEIDLQTTAIVAAVSPERTIEIVESAMASGLLHDDAGSLRFRHAIIREAILLTQSDVRRREIHEAFGRALLARRDDEPERLGLHLRESGRSDLRADAARATAGEAEQAMRRGGVLVAASRFGTAADLGSRAGIPVRELTRWNLRRCDALVAAGRLEEAHKVAVDAAEIARRDGRSSFVECVVRAVGPVIPTGEMRNRAEDLVADALDWPWGGPDGDIDVELAEAASRVVVSRAGRMAERVRGHVRPTLERAAKAPDRPREETLGHLGLRALEWSDQRRTDVCLAHARSAVAAGRRSGDPDLQLRAQRAFVTDLFATTDDTFADAIGRYRRDANGLGSPFHVWTAARIEGAWHRATGDNRKAAACALVAHQAEAAVDVDIVVSAYVTEEVAFRIRRHRLHELYLEKPGAVDHDLVPSVELGLAAVAAWYGKPLDLGWTATTLERAPHGPLRAVACAFAVLAMGAHAESTGEVDGRLVATARDGLAPLAGGVVLVEGGSACLGPADAYLAACCELSGDLSSAARHHDAAAAVANRFIPAWAGWTVRRRPV